MTRAAMRCVFHVAAGPRVGFGHLMRARTLARALGVPMRVALRGGATARRVAVAQGWTVVPGSTDADVVVIDDPSPTHVTTRAAGARRRGAVVVHIADGVTSPGIADLVIDGRVQAPKIGRAHV